MKKNVLVVVSTMGQFPEMFRIAEQLKKSEDFRPIVYFNLGAFGEHPNLSHCVNNGVDILDYNFGFVPGRQGSLVNPTEQQKGGVVPEPVTIPVTPFKILKNFIKHNLPLVFKFIRGCILFLYKFVHFMAFFYLIGIKIYRIKKEKRHFQTHDIRLMVFAEDSEDYFTPQLIRYGHDHGVKSVVFPYTFANQYEFLEDAFFTDRRVNRNPINYFTGHFFPKWTRDYKGKKLLKSYPALILTSEMAKTSPPNPWVMSSGFSDVIAVESQFMKEYYQTAGIPAEQILETGYPSLDYLCQVVQNKEFYRKKLATQLNLDMSKPWVVCAVPPSQWPRAGVGFDTYENFLKEFLPFLTQSNDVEVLFKFHPRLDLQDVMRICDQYRIKCVFEDTVELIGVSDLYIASASSTIRWSVAIGVPTINYDMYNYSYGDFDKAQNHYTAVTFDDFKSMYEKLSTSMAKVPFQTEYARLDGQAGHRILNLFKNLTDHQKSQV